MVEDFFSSQHPKLKGLFPPGDVEGSELSYSMVWGRRVGKCWHVLLLSGALHSLLGTSDIRRRLWKVATLLGTPFGLRIHSEDLTKPLQFYLFGICVACCKWGWRTVWISWFEVNKHLPAWYLRCSMMAVVVVCLSDTFHSKQMEKEGLEYCRNHSLPLCPLCPRQMERKGL